jgi:hypothetical protein
MNFKKATAPGPAVEVGELIAKEIRTIEPLVLEIWRSQILPINCALILCLFVF